MISAGKLITVMLHMVPITNSDSITSGTTWLFTRRTIKAGEQISLFDVAEAAKAEAQKPKQPQRPAQKQKKPSIRAQLKAAKEEQQKKPPQREKAQELEV